MGDDNSLSLNPNWFHRPLFTQLTLAVRTSKKSTNQETGLGNRGQLKVLNATKLVQWSYISKIFKIFVLRDSFYLRLNHVLRFLILLKKVRGSIFIFGTENSINIQKIFF